MIDEFHPPRSSSGLTDDDRERFKLSDAQLIVARMYRCASWTKLRDHVAVVDDMSFNPAAERDGYVDFDESFVQLACLDYAQNGPNPHDRIARAHEMLAADPSLASGSLDALATVGAHREVAGWIERRPAAVNESCGPNDWPPLLYATYSRIESPNDDWSALETVRVLLDAGANPDAGFLWRGLVPPFTALTGAIGNGESGPPVRSDRFDIARLLLEAGADPNDGQALYNNGIGGTNHDDPRHLELLLEYGLGTPQDGPWYRRLGSQLRDPAEFLSDELEAAALRDRPNHLRLLAGLGVDLDRPVGRSRKTPARLAAENGNHEILAVLAEAGINTALTVDEELLDAIRSNDHSRAVALLERHPRLRQSLPEWQPGAVKSVPAGGEAILALLLDLGVDINARTGGSGTTALHDAAQGNDVPRARMLIDHGADPNLVDGHIGATPWGWANHFHQTDVAAYLYPLTERNETIIDVAIEYSDAAPARVTTVDALDQRLDDIHTTTSRPVLVQLRSAAATLSIGLGNPAASVALYLDADNRPWHTTGDPSLEVRDLRFTALGGEFAFYDHAALRVSAARQIAREFAAQPGQRPRSGSWQIEGSGPG